MSFQVIEYKPGAGTVIGIDAVAKETPTATPSAWWCRASASIPQE